MRTLNSSIYLIVNRPIFFFFFKNSCLVGKWAVCIYSFLKLCIDIRTIISLGVVLKKVLFIVGVRVGGCCCKRYNFQLNLKPKGTLTFGYFLPRNLQKIIYFIINNFFEINFQFPTLPGYEWCSKWLVRSSLFHFIRLLAF